MLTRLTENGTAMCHRYWPEEGSELYHIYEVRISSEIMSMSFVILPVFCQILNNKQMVKV
jgi:hypothetical protein